MQHFCLLTAAGMLAPSSVFQSTKAEACPSLLSEALEGGSAAIYAARELLAGSELDKLLALLCNLRPRRR